MKVHEEFEKVAYGLYEKSGRIDGYDLNHWIEAEQIVAAWDEDQQEKKEPGSAVASEKGPARKPGRKVRSKAVETTL